MSLLRLFFDNLLPVFLCAGAGYWAARRFQLDPRPLAHVAFYLFAPCLVFRLIVRGEMSGGAVLRMAGFALLCLSLVTAVAWFVASRAGWSRAVTAAVVLCVLLPNAGNYGLSVNLFAFGEAGLAQASLFFVAAALLSYTAGVFVASLGREGPGSALIGLLRVPAVWAVPLGFLMGSLSWKLPAPLERSVGLFADACIPVFLVILGMQLQGLRERCPLGPLLAAASLRLVGGALAALLLAAPFGLESAARQAGILQSAMPSAVICTILATEYDLEPALVTAVVFLTTLLSPLTLTPLLFLLGA